MTATEYPESLRRVLIHEGGYVNHPSDPGGATNKGVTQAVYDGYRRRSGLPTRSVRDIVPEEVAAVYRTQYWDKIQGDKLPDGVAYVVFDAAVNSGVVQSVKWLQRALGSLYEGRVDGVMGLATIKAVNAHPDHDALIQDMISRRMAMLEGLRTWKTFGKGWTRRVSDVLKHGQAAASGSVGPEPKDSSGSAKARIEDLATPPAPIGASAGASGGGMGTIAVIENVQSKIEPYVTSFPWAGNVFLGLTIVGGLVTVGGIAYGVWASKRNKKNGEIIDGTATADIAVLHRLPEAA